MALPNSWLRLYLALPLLLSACSDTEAGSPQRDNATPLAASDDRDVQSDLVVDGRIYAEVNGERRVWYVAHLERQGDWQSGSFWRQLRLSGAQVSIFGLTEQSARPTGQGDIQLSFMIADPGGTSSAQGSVINLFADGFSKTWSSDTGGSAQLLLNRFERDGEYIELGGGFSANVVLPDQGNAATETDQPRTFTIKDGTFVARLREFQR